MEIKKGQIYYADLSPVKGSEQGGVRPVVIIQNNMGNAHSPTTIVACITSMYHMKNKIPTHIEIPTTKGYLPNDSLILCEQIRVIDKSRLQKYVSMLDNDDTDKMNKALKISLALS